MGRKKAWDELGAGKGGEAPSEVVEVPPTLGEKALDAVGAISDPTFALRYGVPSGEKYRMALQGAIPGAQPIKGQGDLPREERRAAGYLFGKKWPSIAPVGTEVANTLRFWEDPSLHQVARDATFRGVEDARRMKPLPAAPPSSISPALQFLNYVKGFGR